MFRVPRAGSKQSATNWRQCARLAFMAGIFIAQLFGQVRSQDEAEIHGRITECWEGKRRPVYNLRVHVLAMEQSENIRMVIKEMQQLPPGESAESQQRVKKFNELYDELVVQVKAVGEPSGLTRTAKDGRFDGKKLRRGSRYLVLAIDWDRDSDDLGYFRYSLTNNLPPGVTPMNIYMGPGNESDCKGN